MCGSRLHIHGLHVLFAFRNVTLGNDGGIHALRNGLFDNLIVHIGKIGHKIHLVAFMLHVPSYRVKNNHRTGVSDMNKIIYGRSAYVHFDLPLLKGDKVFFSL